MRSYIHSDLKRRRELYSYRFYNFGLLYICPDRPGLKVKSSDIWKEQVR